MKFPEKRCKDYGVKVKNSVLSTLSNDTQTMKKFDEKYGIQSLIGTLGRLNATQVFIHDTVSIRNAEKKIKLIPGLEKYDQRALLIARPHDLVCVRTDVDTLYLVFLSGFGIGPNKGNIVTAPEGISGNCIESLSVLFMKNNDALLKIKELIGETRKIVLDPYISSQNELEFSDYLSIMLGRKVDFLNRALETVSYADGKHNIRTEAMALDVPVPEGEIVELLLGKDGRPLDLDPVRAAIDRLMNRTGSVIIKGAYGTSGSSLFIARNNSRSVRSVLNRISEKNDNRFYIVEVLLDLVCSPNILMHICPGHGSILCVGVTDQILDENRVHGGNVYPSTAETLEDMIRSSRKICKRLQAKGYVGPIGFDFGEYFHPGTDHRDYFIAEVNPRRNAADYPMGLMEHLNKRQEETAAPPIEAFLSANLKTKASSFTELSEKNGYLFFNPETGKGVFPYNTACLENGKVSIAVLGKTRTEVCELYKNFKAIASIEGCLT